MGNPLKLGKHISWKKAECIFCKKSGITSYSNFRTNWICYDCLGNLKYTEYQKVWFLKYNKSIDKLEVIYGTIVGYGSTRVNTYRIEYRTPEESFDIRDIYEEYIFTDKEECIKYGNSIGVVASELELQDLSLMKKQDKLYKQIKEFFKSSEAIKFNVCGIKADVKDGYVNVEWEFNDRKIGDIKDDI